ncbi:NAD(P)-dependent oxidoreductase [Alisedimentitalea sp. MJ-SS2]|uniref:NAD(P)-dependent oxidoreductase n=1 Tax=Aliisedimentitalea sp. MJ-SS2 TaxID=3049795 RepID=UPI002915B011|nr:NAD(P)-dependent oxidoreductase [Alisedimentitalea sp. MJ-SS2]MDU8926751.1 NAD(P)-dependent oxidoreductase [Alisedimentitalea sp. MJ-SS2]
MGNSPRTPGLAAGRLPAETLAQNFADLHEPLDSHEAAVAADRCYFCHDAPCMEACPTSIDIPLFIRQIATDTPLAAARTILEQNILGGMCARVCPTETLCEEVCVRETAEGKPVEIGRLQRFATDAAMSHGPQPFSRAVPSGKSVAVVGAGPAGLACAHRLAMHGHDVVVYDAREKAGGLNEFGIASYKAVDGFAGREVDWLLGIGGIKVKTGQALGRDVDLDGLAAGHDAVFLGVGLGDVNTLGLAGEDLDGVGDAVDWIADLRQAGDMGSVSVGSNVVVIGGGMTAVDAAVQAKALGAGEVTLAYRRRQDQMKASGYEQELAATKGVRIVTEATPEAILGNGAIEAVEFSVTGSDERFRVTADQLLCAIGQKLVTVVGLDTEGGKIVVDDAGRTSREGVWAGGDCASGGDDLTVTAVAEGRDAAEDIHAVLTGVAG